MADRIDDYSAATDEASWIGVYPIARGVCEDIKINPWDVLTESTQQQSLLDLLRRDFEVGVNRIITAPFEDLNKLPLLSNPGRKQLPMRPWEGPARDDAGKFAKVG